MLKILMFLAALAPSAAPQPPVAGKVTDHVIVKPLGAGWEMRNQKVYDGDALVDAVTQDNASIGGTVVVSVYPEETDAMKMAKSKASATEKMGWKTSPPANIVDDGFKRVRFFYAATTKENGKCFGVISILPMPGAAKGLVMVAGSCCPKLDPHGDAIQAMWRVIRELKPTPPRP